MPSYVTYDVEGNITGAYDQAVLQEHRGAYLPVDPSYLPVWVNYRMSGDRKSLIENSVVVNLQEIKDEVNTVINNWRLTTNMTSFPYLGKYISCDTLSRSDIDGVSSYINFFSDYPSPLPSAWKATDNTYVPITSVADFKNMYKAMVVQGNANFARAQQLKAQLAAATTVEQIEAVRNSI